MKKDEKNTRQKSKGNLVCLVIYILWLNSGSKGLKTDPKDMDTNKYDLRLGRVYC